MVKLISLAELIELAIQAEHVARKVYLGFTHKFLSNEVVSNFWQIMADDERDHAWILSELRANLSDDDKHMPIDARLAEKATTLRDLNAQALVNSVTNLDDAYRVAYDLESSEVNTVFNFLTIRFLSHEESCDIITATIDRHLLRLAEFSHTFGNTEQCRDVAATA